MAVALLSEEQLEELLERAAERGSRKALEAQRAGSGGPEDFDTAGAAAHSGVSVYTVRDWIRRRGLPAQRPEGGRDYRIRRKDLEEFLATPAKRRPPREHGPVDLAVLAGKIVRGQRG